MDPVKSGLEVLLEDPVELLAGRRVGLITNPTGVTRGLESGVDVFHQHPGVNLAALFGPEHGFRADAPDGVQVASGINRWTGLPIYSLYGEARRPTPDMLAGLDTLVFDIQDVGARFYTYISTLLYAMQAAADAGLSCLVLDRPNPINGVTVEGPVLQPGFESFVGPHTLPIRHGMTVGELARLFHAEFALDLDLKVVPARGWQRAMWFDQTGLPWVPPSPNMPHLMTATLYPGTCLIEGTNLSEGRGTPLPFEVIGAPWLDAEAAARALNKRHLPGVRFRPTYFTPGREANKYPGQPCAGIQVHVLDREALPAVAVGLHLIDVIRRRHPEAFAWREHPQPEGIPSFDRLAGSDRLRRQLEQGVPVEDIVAGWEPELATFRERRARYLIYQ